MSREIFLKYFSFLIGRFGVAGMAFASDIVLARLVSQDSRGSFYVFLTTITTLALLLIWGLQNSVTAKAANRQPASISILLDHLKLLLPGIFILFICTQFLPVDWLGSNKRGLVFFSAGFLMVVMVIRSFLLGIGADRWYLFLLIGDRLLFLLMLVLAVGPQLLLPQSAYGISMAGLLLLSLIGLVHSRSNYDVDTKKFADRDSLKEILKFGLSSYLGNVLIQLMSRASVYVLSWELGSTSVSVFMTALLLSQLALQFPMFISTLVFRDAAREFDSKVVSRIALFSFIFAFVMSFLVYWGRELIIQIIYGETYSISADHVGLLLMGGMMLSPAIVLMNALLGKGHTYLYAGVFGTGFIVNLIANVLLVPQYFILGAGIASVASGAVCLALSYYYFNKLSRVREISK